MRAPRWLAETLVRAAQATSVDPAYLIALADKGSGPLGSSPEGLFRFAQDIWLEVLRRYGPKHGYAAEARTIQFVGARPIVPDHEERGRILSLRRDPYLSALMAGEMINTHQQLLAGKIAYNPSFSELYIAYLLGVQGASRFAELLSGTPAKSVFTALPPTKTNRAPSLASKEGVGRRRKLPTVIERHARLDAAIAQRASR